MEVNEVAYPLAVGFLGAWAVALHPHVGLHPVHLLRWLVVRIHTAAPSRYVYAYSIIGSGKTRKRANSG